MQGNRQKITTVAVIGAGNIGSRHLQALARSARIGRVEALGRSAPALAIAEERYRSVGAGRQTALFTQDMARLSERIDVAIIATNSDTRLPALEQLLRTKQIGAVILEKVAFGAMSEFDRAAVALGSIPAWVNCFRRTLPFYAALRAQLSAERSWSLVVEGGEWGVGCNAVHYVDLCAYLAGTEDVRIDPDSTLDAMILSSKRRGFLEFTGSVSGSCGGRRFKLVAHAGSAELARVRIETSERTLLDTDERELPFQSELTHLLVEEIVETGASSLPTLAQSRAVHAPLLALFSGHLERIMGQRLERCPVT